MAVFRGCVFFSLCAFYLSCARAQSSEPSSTHSANASSSAASSASFSPSSSFSLSFSLSNASLPTSSVASASSSVNLSSIPFTLTSSVAGSSATITQAPTSAEITLGTTGSSVPLSSEASFASGNATSTESGCLSFFTPSGTGPGGYNVQPTADPAETHPFSPFPSPTQGPVDGIYPSTDPLSPPDVTELQIVPDFNPAWDAAWEKAQALIAGFDIEDKVNISTGVGWMNGRCVGNTPPVPFNGSGVWQGLCLEDSPLGVRDADFATAFPAGINAAATWQRSLLRKRGIAMGQEHKGKGVNVALGPMMNLGRIAQGGRNWEGFGADPFLSGEAAYETILGMQAAGVQACAKHYINNEQEWQRTMESSNVDDRTEHEMYGHPFLRSVMAGVASAMCSYNQINETYACENDRTLNQILKGELGFRGYVMSDWGAHHATLDAIQGLDMSMPGDQSLGSGNSFWGPNLTAYVMNGSVSEERLDDMATRVVAGWYYLHQDEDYPAVNFDAFKPVNEATNEHIDVQDDHWKIVREIGAKSSVLLKNKNDTLPLNKPRRLVMIGSDAGPQIGGPNQFTDNGGNTGILAMGWGSGSANFTYLISPYEAIQARARQDRTTVNWLFNDWDTDTAGNIAIQADVALVFINSDSGEGYITVDGNAGDRNNITAWHNGDNLVKAVAAQNPNTIVVVHSVGPLIIEPWIEHPNVSAVVWAGLGGPETGNALVDVLYGDVNPSGRLPYTIARNFSDYGTELTLGGSDTSIIQIPYAEGLFFDYRHFDANDIEPRFEFGFGLSYTTFSYSDLSITEVDNQFASSDVIQSWKNGEAGPTGEGASLALEIHEPAYTVTFIVQNTGSVNGTEIPQLYVHHPAAANEPPSVLRGFADVTLGPGEQQEVTIALSRYDLSIWDVVTQSWRRPKGEISFDIGASSRDFRLNGVIP